MNVQRLLIIFLLATFFVVQGVSACAVNITYTKDVMIYDSIETNGINASCTLWLFKEEIQQQTGAMTQNLANNTYYYNAGKLDNGIYHTRIECLKTNATSTSQFLGDCEFNIDNEGENLWIAIVVALGLMTLFYYVAAFMIQDKELRGIKVFFILLAVVNTFLIGILMPYVIAKNPSDVTAFVPLALGYVSVNGIALIYFIWNYASHLIFNVFKFWTKGK